MMIKLVNNDFLLKIVYLNQRYSQGYYAELRLVIY